MSSPDPYVSPEVPPSPAAPALPDKDQCMWGMLCHLCAFAGYVIPFGGVIGPLVVWLMKKDEMPFVDDQGKESVNFQISIVIYLLVSGVLILAVIGIVLLPAVIIFDIVMTIVAAIKANSGEAYRYPLCIRFIS